MQLLATKLLHGIITPYSSILATCQFIPTFLAGLKRLSCCLMGPASLVSMRWLMGVQSPNLSRSKGNAFWLSQQTANSCALWTVVKQSFGQNSFRNSSPFAASTGGLKRFHAFVLWPNSDFNCVIEFLLFVPNKSFLKIQNKSWSRLHSAYFGRLSRTKKGCVVFQPDKSWNGESLSCRPRMTSPAGGGAWLEVTIIFRIID